MSAVGGSILEIAIRGRTFAVAADADATIDLGGFSNEVKANGNGTARLIKTRKPWMVSGVKVAIDNTRSDREFLKQIADAQDFVPCTITLVDGITYQGRGILVGDFNGSSADATAEIGLSGPGDATQQ